MRTGKLIAELEPWPGRKILIRPLKAGDLPAALKFANTLVAERRVNRDLGILLSKEVTMAEESRFVGGVVSGMRKGDAVSVAAFDGDILVGHCDVTRREPEDIRHTGLLGIAILDGYRGRGLGESMVKTALREARKIGIQLVELEVFANNSRAIRLYERTGFKLTGRVPGKIRRSGRRIDELSMCIDLEGRFGTERE